MKSPDFDRIHERFSNTDEGKKLASQIRYAHFNKSGVSNEKWEDLLGPDVNNLAHLIFTYKLAKFFLEELRYSFPLSKEEEDVILLTAVTHDWAEAITGDIPYPDKTSADEIEERKHLDVLLQKNIGHEISEDVRNKVLETLFDKESRYYQLFNCIEQMGYMITALRAWEKSKETEGALSEDLHYLACKVTLGHLWRVVEYSIEYQPAREFILANSDLIHEVVNAAPAYAVIWKKFMDENPDQL